LRNPKQFSEAQAAATIRQPHPAHLDDVSWWRSTAQLHPEAVDLAMLIHCFACMGLCRISVARKAVA
jgi:hypothetical protein